MNKRSIRRPSQALHRLLAIGQALVEGPRSLLPPAHVDDFGWLEPNLRLIWWHPGTRKLESIIVFCDDTINRDADFLVPVLRYAIWNRGEDLRTLASWPHVEIQLSYFEQHRDEVSAQIQRIEAALTQAPYVPFGLNTQRDAPDLDAAEDRGTIEIHCSNGLQRMTWLAPALAAGDPLTDTFFAVFARLQEIIVPISREGWREAYEYDFTTEPISHSWYWNGQTPDSESHDS